MVYLPRFVKLLIRNLADRWSVPFGARVTSPGKRRQIVSRSSCSTHLTSLELPFANARCGTTSDPCRRLGIYSTTGGFRVGNRSLIGQLRSVSPLKRLSIIGHSRLR